MNKSTYVLYSVKPELEIAKQRFTKKQIETNTVHKLLSLPKSDILMFRYTEYLDDITRSLNRTNPNDLNIVSITNADFVKLFTNLVYADARFSIKFSTPEDFCSEEDEFNNYFFSYAKQELDDDSKKEMIELLEYLINEYGVEWHHISLVIEHNEQEFVCDIRPNSVVIPPTYSRSPKNSAINRDFTEEDIDIVVHKAYEVLLNHLYPLLELENTEITLIEKEEIPHPLQNSKLVFQELLSNTTISRMSNDLNLPYEEVQFIVEHLLKETEQYEGKMIYKK